MADDDPFAALAAELGESGSDGSDASDAAEAAEDEDDPLGCAPATLVLWPRGRLPHAQSVACVCSAPPGICLSWQCAPRAPAASAPHQAEAGGILTQSHTNDVTGIGPGCWCWRTAAPPRP